jgi:RNA polymerase sigma-70 factor (ECF subfamily)
VAAREETLKLVEKAKRGDPAAFEKLVSRERSRLEAVIQLRLGKALQPSLSSEDVFQETLLRAWSAITRFEEQGERSFARWLAGIAVKVILEAARQKEERYISLEREPLAKEPSPGKKMQREERFDRLEKALHALPPDYRKAVVLVRLGGLSVAEAARRMKRSPNAVSKILLRALGKLRTVLDETESLHLSPLQVLREKVEPPSDEGGTA